VLLAEKGAVQGMSWGSREKGLFEAHKGAKKGARPKVKIRRSKTQMNVPGKRH
jgi:hypothetical protein